jgi:hypothetical protein
MRLLKAKSGLVLVLVLQPNDRTGVTLPDAEIDHRSLTGPKQPVRRFPESDALSFALLRKIETR